MTDARETDSISSKKLLTQYFLLQRQIDEIEAEQTKIQQELAARFEKEGVETEACPIGTAGWRVTKKYTFTTIQEDQIKEAKATAKAVEDRVKSGATVETVRTLVLRKTAQ